MSVQEIGFDSRLAQQFKVHENAQRVETEHETLSRYAEDTWQGIAVMADTPTGLPDDRFIFHSDGSIERSGKTSPTNIGLFLMSAVAEKDLNPNKAEDINKSISLTLNTLQTMKTKDGLYSNWYKTADGSLYTVNEANEPVEDYISSVDNGWLATSLRILRNASHEHAEMADALLKRMDFGKFYDKERNLFYNGIGADGRPKGLYDIELTETRINQEIGIREFGIPSESRTALSSLDPIHIVEKNIDLPRTRNGIRLSWEGPMFQALMPRLVLREPHLTENHQAYVDVQIANGIDGKWGVSTCDDEKGYKERGIAALAINPDTNNDPDCITPHASALALPFRRSEAIQNLRKIEAEFKEKGVYKEGWGFTDSVRVKENVVANSRLVLDQTMFYLGIYNDLSGNKLHDYFEGPTALPLKQDIFVQPQAYVQ